MEPKTPPYESRSQSQKSTPPPSSAAARLWRPAAQRNLRNQWSNLNSLRQDWRSAASAGRSHATAIVNSYLSQNTTLGARRTLVCWCFGMEVRYMDGMEFGVLSDMPNIRKKACSKLFKQQELYRGKLLSSYRDMVAIVTRMVNTCKSMRCYLRGTSNSPLAQFSFSLEDDSDSGDCGGIPVFAFYSVASFEELAWEMVRMFVSELNLKRLLVMELLYIYDEKVAKVIGICWSDEFYDGEFDELSLLNLYSEETREPVLPCLRGCKSSTSAVQSKQQQDSNVLQVYLTTWLVEVNIDRCRVDEIFAIVGGEMHVDFS
ncbi:uncharacterized protein LOC105166426 isoform X1 [Sesamum indicum]|uniref:Uncharacterized protein LOC105166426 isoform X1 n=1 Tax=Sesamum indicum TaxID=4182 RepID=A0A8M8V3G6_SESIN|nr:uncharacterized protein LOC105166426 isoform X1 [Sesamum indicum]